ncbi:Tex family protein [Lapidilactobacillus mulanensis]|uniref:Tex family protein n=1 Tax=Lapidilactobacillus mulanensis TaxID=2485999 RepID=A0ABW4DM99_9LACO|nr:Tex family protein [Lapidilactobacillus mulanensis]
MSEVVIDSKARQATQRELNLPSQAITAVLTMLGEGNTVPFIARYRKERTGSLDEVQIRAIEAEYQRVIALNKRKEDVTQTIEEQGKLTAELAAAIAHAAKIQQVEDLYLPYKQKRKSKATVARAAGLSPLAAAIKLQSNLSEVQWQQEAAKFVNDELDLPTTEEVWQGVHEILAEEIGDEADFRDWTRRYIQSEGHLVATVKDEEADTKGVYRNYYNFDEPLSKLVSHRVLAINRAEKENVLKVSIAVNSDNLLKRIETRVNLHRNPFASEQMNDAVQDAYKRFIGPAIEREIRASLKESADAQAISVFGENLKNLLLQPPLKGKVVLGFDPAYRTGCKLAIVDGTGKFLAKLVIYPHKPANAKLREQAMPIFIDFLEKYQVEMIAIGNGTASRESEQFVSAAIKQLSRPVYYVIVNEAGASVYSASDNARAEFPDLHVEERSAVSIARRLQDPLAELLKIDPQAVGVGQYQHDVSQKALTEQLDIVVEDVVNHVGVNLNTASVDLLQHISGLSTTISQNIVAYRNENGQFDQRKQLQKVPRLGPKTYQQAIGFLRIIDGKEPLDNTDIHPESYQIAGKLLAKLDLTKADLGTPELQSLSKLLNVEQLASEWDVGVATLKDIIEGLRKPGRDLRDNVAAPLLRQDVLSIEDLQPEMILQGTVRNVVDFGAFVDIGIKHDGLVHISELADHFVKNASAEVAVGDIVKVRILSVDLDRERVQLSMRGVSDD